MLIGRDSELAEMVNADRRLVRPFVEEVLRIEPGAVPRSGRLLVRLTPSVSDSASDAMEYLFGFPFTTPRSDCLKASIDFID